MKRDRQKSRYTFRRRGTETKVLVVDSDPVMAALLQDYLESEKGYVVLSAETGAEGMRMAMEEAPDLILLDFRLSDMSGLELHERLRQDAIMREIPVVYASSFLTLRRIEQATTKGARGFITKPFTRTEIHSKVATVLSLK